MTREEEARRAALDAFQKVIVFGRGIDIAFDVAAVKYRTYYPEASEYEVRMALAEGLAEARLAARGLIDSRGKVS